MPKLRTLLRAAGIAGSVLSAAACGALPKEGPSAAEITKTSDRTAAPFAIVDLTPEIADLLSVADTGALERTFGSGSAVPNLQIGVGDSVAVTIFESASGGLFSGEPGSIGAGNKNVSLPPQVVAQDGTISIPFAGRIRAAGRTPRQVQAVAEDVLRPKAIQPQVILTVTNARSTDVSVIGEVGRPGQQALDLGGQRLLDAIAAAGGPRNPEYETFVRVNRGSASATVSLSSLIEHPSENIFLHPGDQVFVAARPATFTAMGATLGNSQVPFRAARLSLAEAVGRVGGLIDLRSDASGVFIFRYEDPATLESVTSRYSARVTGARLQYVAAMPSVGVPVVYRLNLKDPVGYFAAQRFAMKSGDILYVANAPAVEFGKAIELFRSGLSVPDSAASTVSRVGL